jgi:hypothetical protein
MADAKIAVVDFLSSLQQSKGPKGSSANQLRVGWVPRSVRWLTQHENEPINRTMNLLSSILFSTLVLMMFCGRLPMTLDQPNLSIAM